MAIQFSLRRNSADKIRRLIDDAIQQGPYIPSILAAELVRKLREESPDLLVEWLNLHAEQLMREAIVTISAFTRREPRTRAKSKSRSVFRMAVAKADDGDPGLLKGWLAQEYVAGPSNVRKRFGEMIKEEVLYTADMYEGLARSNQMESAFLHAVANKLGGRMVSEVFNEQELDRLWGSLQ